nr:hypothetical protein [Tanacetum cinerariifolium]
CQPIAQNIDFSGSDQIQTPQYPEIHSSSPETSDEVFQANHSIQSDESFENSSNQTAVSNSNEEKEIPPQDSDFHQLIEECSIEICEEQKRNYDDDFEDIEYVEASLSDPEIVSIEEENGVEEENTRSGNTTHANYSLPEYKSFCFEIEPDQERLINLVENDILNNSINDPLLEEVDLFISDNSIPS